MKCPDCGMENYAGATVCNCGHLFYSSLSPDPGTRKCLSCGREITTATQTCECGQDPTAVPVERVSNQENEEVPAETRRKAHLDAHGQLKKSLGLTRFAQSVLVLFATAAGIKALSGFLIAIIYGGRIRELVWLLRFSASAWDSTELNLVLVASATLSFVLVWMWITSASKSALLLGLLNRETADLQYSSLAKNYFRPFWGISQKVRHMKDLYEAVLDTWAKKDAQHTAGQNSPNRSTGVTISVWTLLYVGAYIINIVVGRLTASVEINEANLVGQALLGSSAQLLWALSDVWTFVVIRQIISRLTSADARAAAGFDGGQVTLGSAISST